MPAPRPFLRALKCSICGQPSMPGGRLCAPCKSALKRARDTTVSEAIPPLRAARKRPVPPVVAPAVPSTPAHPWIASVAWVAAVVVVVAAIGSWFAHMRGSGATAAPSLAAAPAESNPESAKSGATDVRVPLMSSTATSPPADRTASPPIRAPIDPRTLPSNISVPRPANAVTPPVTAAQSERMPGTPVFGAGPDLVPAPAPVVVAQATPAPRPAPDRWQRLSEALARCPANDTIARTMCQESLRIESCEGFWGRVAACPARVEREYGN